MKRLVAPILLLAALPACGKKRASPPPGRVEWVKEPIPASDPNVEINAISGTSADDVWAVGWGIYHYDGKAWTNVMQPAGSSALNAMSVVSRADIWAVGVYGQIAHFDGKTWKAWRLDEARVDKSGAVKGYYDLLGVAAWPGEVWVSIQQLWGTSPRDVWLPGGPAHFDGSRWETPAVLPNPMRSVHGVAPNDVWMVGWIGNHKDNRGAATHFDGKSWSPVAVPAGTALLWTVFAARNNEAYAVGDDGWAIAWNGTAWRPSATGVNGLLTAIYSPGGGQAFAGGRIGPYVLHKR